MSLRVWMPLTGDLRNNGLSNTTITNNGAVVNDNGKRLVYINTGKFCRDGYLNLVTEQDENGKWHLVE